MTNTNDLRTIVASAAYDALASDYQMLESQSIEVADAAIRAVIEHLAGEAESGHPDCLTPCATDCDDGWAVPLADWLRKRMGNAPVSP